MSHRVQRFMEPPRVFGSTWRRTGRCACAELPAQLSYCSRYDYTPHEGHAVNSVRHNSCWGLRRGRYTIEFYATRTGAALSFTTEGHRHGTLPTALAVRGDPPRVQIFSPAGPAL